MQTFRAHEVADILGYRLIVIERVDLVPFGAGWGGHVTAKVEPVVVLVESKGEVRGIDMLANPIALAKLKEDIPGFDNLVEPYLDA